MIRREALLVSVGCSGSGARRCDKEVVVETGTSERGGIVDLGRQKLSAKDFLWLR